MNLNTVCGEFPRSCYKAFKDKCYAQQFMESGIFRLGCLRYYRHIEDSSRRDPTEGKACTVEPGITTEGWASSNPDETTIWITQPGYRVHYSEFSDASFCFCTSLPDVDLRYLRGTFGEFIVKIEDPRRLAEDINERLASSGRKFVVIGCHVEYNKGERLERELTHAERGDLSYAQKPRSFADEHEFRIVAITREPLCSEDCRYLSGQFELTDPDCQFLQVNIGKRVDYVQYCAP